jgi:hypothetical protein
MGEDYKKYLAPLKGEFKAEYSSYGYEKWMEKIYQGPLAASSALGYYQSPPTGDAWLQGVSVKTYASKMIDAVAVDALFPPMQVHYAISNYVLETSATDEYAIHGAASGIAKHVYDSVYAAVVANLKKQQAFTQWLAPAGPIQLTNTGHAGSFVSYYEGGGSSPANTVQLGKTVVDTLAALLPPGTLDTVVPCPGCGTPLRNDATCDAKPYTLMSQVMHLNDAHRWTREKIADWLDTLDVDLAFKTPTEDEGEK